MDEGKTIIESMVSFCWILLRESCTWHTAASWLKKLNLKIFSHISGNLLVFSVINMLLVYQ